MAHEVKDISSEGLYLRTEQRWYPGTLVMLSLQRADLPSSHPDCSIALRARVIRSDSDGVGFSIVMSRADSSGDTRSELTGGADKKSFEKFLRQFRNGSDNGQALVEYALTLPLLLILIVNLVNFGGFFYAWIGVSNAARAAADYAILGGASAGSPSEPNGTQLSALLTGTNGDTLSLPNRASLQINICKYSNTTLIQTLLGTCSATATTQQTDPEPSSYVLTSVDITYTYVPFIPASFRFPGLNLYATIPPTTIRRRAVMRSIR